jgi:hypothetical protein
MSRFRVLSDAARALVGGAVIYVAMVACSTSAAPRPGFRSVGDADEDEGAGGRGAVSGAAGNAEGGGTGSGGSPVEPRDAGLVDALVDAIRPPIRDAEAAPPQVFTVQCDVEVPQANGVSHFFAEQAFPGLSVEQLAGVSVVFRYKAEYAKDGYAHQVALATLKPGSARAFCGAQATGGADAIPYESATFVLRQ